MNIRLVKREIANLKMLVKIKKNYGSSIFFWSLVDGVVRRLHLNRLYEKTHYYRHEACKRYLRKRYYCIIEKYKNIKYDSLSSIGKSSPVWRYWHQGIENAPYPVDLTLKSSAGKCNDHPVIILNSDNYKDYISIPKYIEDKCKKHQMNIAVFSDFLRLALLKEYGGIWLDSTFWVANSFPTEIDEMPFYSIKQGNVRKWVITRDLWSVCLLASGPQNPLVCFCYDFLNEFWKKEDTPIAYLMTDCIIGLGYEEIPIIKQLIDSVPNNNECCFEFLTSFKDKTADYTRLKEMKKSTFIYQLSYKFKWEKKDKKGRLTNFGALTKDH